MLRRLSLRDVAIVTELELDLSAGFSALTGETGAGKSILIEALQLALGNRADAVVVREGAARAEVSAEFDVAAAQRANIAQWLEDGGFDANDELLLRRQVDTLGKSRAWINGRAATLTQLRELAQFLVDIHGQHAWQSLTRPDTVRGLLDAYGQVDTKAQTAAWQTWREADTRWQTALAQQTASAEQRERLQWQLSELDKLAPAPEEWAHINQEHTRLSHAQSIMEGARAALDLCGGDNDSARSRLSAALQQLQGLAHFDVAVQNAIAELNSTLAQLQDVEHSLGGILNHTDLDPNTLASLDERLTAWMSLARKFRLAPESLPATQAAWNAQLLALEAANDVAALEQASKTAKAAFMQAAEAVGRARLAAAPSLSQAVTAAMQELGMAGGAFEVALLPLSEPQSFGLHQIEFRVAGHAGSTPRALAKVASGGELSRIALAIAVCTSALGAQGTLMFDEVDSGVGGSVAQAVGRMMQRLGLDRQVLTITHLAQVAAYADQHLVVSKTTQGGLTSSAVRLVQGAARVQEIARMLGAAQDSSTGLAHAQEMLEQAQQPVQAPASGSRRAPTQRKRA